MIDAISKLVESGAISEDVQKGIQEAPKLPKMAPSWMPRSLF